MSGSGEPRYNREHCPHATLCFHDLAEPGRHVSELHGIASRGQDIRTPPYQHMLSVFGEAFAEGKPFIYASGHDHILEVLDGGAMAGYLLVSGSGSKRSPVKHGAGTLFDTYGEGFMIVDFLTNGGVTLTVVKTDDAPEAGVVVFTMQLDD